MLTEQDKELIAARVGWRSPDERLPRDAKPRTALYDKLWEMVRKSQLSGDVGWRCDDEFEKEKTLRAVGKRCRAAGFIFRQQWDKNTKTIYMWTDGQRTTGAAK